MRRFATAEPDRVRRLPLLKDGKPIGAIVFLSSEIGAFSPELIALLQRLAENARSHSRISIAPTKKQG